MHPNIVEFEVYGDYALFSDPITRVGGEKCTYQIPTYEALKGILHSVFWKPTIIWVIDAVRVLRPIQMETKGIKTLKYQRDKKDGKSKHPYYLSYYTYLKDCRYQVRAHFIWNENRPELAHDRNENKFHNMAKRMIEKGGRRDIFLGTRECQGYVEPCTFGEGKGAYDDVPELSFGLMLHGITYPDEAYNEATKGKMSTRFFIPVMKNGVITFPKPEECTVTRPIREMGIKPFGKEHANFKPIAEEEVN